jgi:hypothetical protein
MTENEILERYAQAQTIPKIYEVVKQAVQLILGKSRRAMMLGLADLGGGGQEWIGGYHIIASNAIIMNSRPLKYVESHHPELYKPYIFLILLHEYIHTLGFHDEAQTRERTLFVAQAIFGEHPVTEMARDIAKFLPFMQQVQYGWQPSGDPSIYYLVGFDESSAYYYV